MKKTTKKGLVIGVLLVLGLSVILGIGVFKTMQNHYKEVEIEKSEKRKNLKKYETEIVQDIANKYAGVKEVKFDKYNVSPMGSVNFDLYINDNQSNNALTYTMEDDIKKPYLSVSSNLNLRKGKSDFDSIKINYNYEEHK